MEFAGMQLPVPGKLIGLAPLEQSVLWRELRQICEAKCVCSTKVIWLGIIIGAQWMGEKSRPEISLDLMSLLLRQKGFQLSLAGITGDGQIVGFLIFANRDA